MTGERIAKYIASVVSPPDVSRRRSLNGRVTLNGAQVTDLSTKVMPGILYRWTESR